MNVIAHVAGWIALVLIAAGAARSVARGSHVTVLDAQLLHAGAGVAGFAVLMYAAASQDPLIGVLAAVWLALSARGAWRRWRRTSIGTYQAPVQRRPGRDTRPALRVVRGGRASGGTSPPSPRARTPIETSRR